MKKILLKSVSMGKMITYNLTYWSHKNVNIELSQEFAAQDFNYNFVKAINLVTRSEDTKTGYKEQKKFEVNNRLVLLRGIHVRCTFITFSVLLGCLMREGQKHKLQPLLQQVWSIIQVMFYKIQISWLKCVEMPNQKLWEMFRI